MKQVDSSSIDAMQIAPQTVANLARAVLNLLDSLDPSQKEFISFQFDSDERFNWHYTPVERNGLPLRSMTDQQRDNAMEVMAAGLSDKGLAQAQAIISHEITLKELEQNEGTLRWDRDPELYFFSVFGDPSIDSPWSCRIEGHHLSLHFLVIGTKYMAVTPSFFGANPAKIPYGPQKGLRIHANIEDQARELALTLNHKQRSKAIVLVEAPADILTTNDKYANLKRIEGIPASELSGAQREMLVSLLGEYIGRKPVELATKDLSKIIEGNGLDSLHFSWAGSLDIGQPHYYRIHGPRLLIEYDNVQNDANHVHSVWRDPGNDFGFDLLRWHQMQEHKD